MVKRGALSKVEKFYIDGNADLSAEDIAIELDRSVSIIQKHRIATGGTIETKEPEPTPPKKPETQFLKQMGRHERNGKKVAAVMTKEASMTADASRTKRLMNKKLQTAIHRPMD